MKSRREPLDSLNRLTHEVIGAAIEVHSVLGAGFSENVYEEALEVEFKIRRILYERQKELVITYKDQWVGKAIADFLVGNQIVVELKAVEEIKPIHESQVISYLKARKLHLGLLINFNVTILKDGIRRIVHTP